MPPRPRSQGVPAAASGRVERNNWPFSVAVAGLGPLVAGLSVKVSKGDLVAVFKQLCFACARTPALSRTGERGA